MSDQNLQKIKLLIKIYKVTQLPFKSSQASEWFLTSSNFNLKLIYNIL